MCQGNLMLRHGGTAGVLSSYLARWIRIACGVHYRTLAKMIMLVKLGGELPQIFTDRVYEYIYNVYHYYKAG